MGRGGGEQDSEPVVTQAFTEDERAVIEKAYALFESRLEWDTKTLANIRGKSIEPTHAVYRRHRDVLESITEDDVQTLADLLLKANELVTRAVKIE